MSYRLFDHLTEEELLEELADVTVLYTNCKGTASEGSWRERLEILQEECGVRFKKSGAI